MVFPSLMACRIDSTSGSAFTRVRPNPMYLALWASDPPTQGFPMRRAIFAALIFADPTMYLLLKTSMASTAYRAERSFLPTPCRQIW